MCEMKQLSMYASGDVKDLISDFLIGLNAHSVSENEEHSKYKISAIFDIKTPEELIIKKLDKFSTFLKKNYCNSYISDSKIEYLNRSDWDLWKKVLKPVRASSRIAIKPPWEVYEQNHGETVIDINHSMAFGTGHHETTRLCIQLIDELTCKNIYSSMLDVGCGSGVLSIAAISLGLKSVVAFDTDKTAVSETKKNIIRNSTKNIIFFCGSIKSIKNCYDIVVANISVDVIRSLRKDLKEKLNKEGRLILSGIPLERSEELKNIITSSGFSEIKQIIEGEWTSLLFKHIK